MTIVVTTVLLGLGACSATATQKHVSLKAVPASPYLRPATNTEVIDCTNAAQMVGLDVLCPLVLPKGQYTDPWCKNDRQDPCAYSSSVYGASFLAQAVFTAPKSYVGVSPGLGHFVVWATTQRNRVVVPCLIGRKVGAIENGGRNWDIWHCGQQSLTDPGIEYRNGHEIVDGGEVMQGHIVFATTVHGTNTEVSLHGVTSVNLRLLVKITARMQQSDTHTSTRK